MTDTTKTVEQRLSDIEASLIGIAFTLSSLANQPMQAPSVSKVDEHSPPAAPAIPRRVYAYQENGLLADGWAKEPVSGARIDPVVDADCPSDPLAPDTDLYVSKARPDLGERWIGYVIRVSAQCKGGLSRLGAAGYMAEASFAPYGGFKADGSNWPFAAVKFHRTKAGDSNAPGWISGQPLPGPGNVPRDPAPVDVPISN